MALLRFSRESNEVIRTRILNLSEGGVFFTAASNEERLNKLDKGGRLILVKISGTTPGLNIQHTEMEVRWTIYDKFLDHIGFGCEFVDIAEQTRRQIVGFVARSGG